MRLQLIVWHTEMHQASCYGIPESGWRIDTTTRQLVLGKGIPRQYVPLDNVLSYLIEEVPDAD